MFPGLSERHYARGDIKYIKFEILQIVSPSEDVKFSNVRGLYLRKYGKYTFKVLVESLMKDFEVFSFTSLGWNSQL